MSVRYYNAFLPGNGDLTEVQFTVAEGKILDISQDSSPLPAQEHIDCRGCILLPAFTDSHIHLPGNLLYQRYGVNLMNCQSVQEYRERILAYNGDAMIVRGFGWSQRLFQNDPEALGAFKAFLDEIFPTTPVILFSDDYHSCICNQPMLDSAARYLPPQQNPSSGLLTERSVFALLHRYHGLLFSRQQTEEGLLAYQDFLLARGITAIQTLMPIGINETHCYHILQDLEARGLWKVRVNFALTMHPTDSFEKSLALLRSLQPPANSLLHLSTVKLYIDGVVDNGSAFLSSPYENSTSCGSAIWDDALLTEFCRFFDRENIQIHAHVIGDAAAAQIADALACAMEENGHLHNENRHVLAHVQLLSEETAQKIACLSLLCSLQPYWFSQGEIYPVDLAMLGSRAETEYPCASLAEKGVCITFGSDNPVTDDPSPLLGIACAINRMPRSEALSLSAAIDAFTRGGAYQLFREKEMGQLLCGMDADFVLIHAPNGFSSAEEISSCRICRTYSKGTCLYTSKEA